MRNAETAAVVQVLPLLFRLLHSDFRNHFLLNLAAHGDRIKRELRDRGLIADLLKLKLVGPLCVDKLRVERSPWQFPCE